MSKTEFKEIKTVATLNEESNYPILIKLISADGNIGVDARKYYSNRYGELSPTQKGIFLNPSQIDDFCAALRRAKVEFEGLYKKNEG